MARVLIAEDEEDTSRAIAEFLQSRGHTVHVASTGTAALALADSFKPDVLLCSLLLEGEKSALEVARGVTATSPGLNVLFISGLPADELKFDFSGIPVRDVLVKPVSLERVARAAEGAVRDEDPF